MLNIRDWPFSLQVFYYSVGLFESAGLTPQTASYATSGVGVVMVVMTFITIPLMDRVGRRTLHLSGLASMFVFSILITVTLALRVSHLYQHEMDDSAFAVMWFSGGIFCSVYMLFWTNEEFCVKFIEFIFMWLHETHVSKHFVCTLKNVSLDTRLEMEDSCSLPGIHLQNVYITHGENLLKVSVISQTKST